MKTIWIGALFLSWTGVVAAQEKTNERSQKPVTSLKVQLVLSEYEGDKKISSLPYTLSVNADEPRQTRVRTGVDVPLPMEGAESKFVYKTVGTSIDCEAHALEDGRFNVRLAVEKSSLYSAEKNKKGAESMDAPTHAPPLFRSFSSTFNVVLRDGQTAQYSAATDPISGQVLKIEATLNVVK
jgi:hypothetical protein